MDRVNVICPTCGKKGHVRQEFVGKKVTCTGCRSDFRAGPLVPSVKSGAAEHPVLENKDGAASATPSE